MRYIILITDIEEALETLYNKEYRGCTGKSPFQNQKGEDDFTLMFNKEWISISSDSFLSKELYQEEYNYKLPFSNPNFIILNYSLNGENVLADFLREITCFEDALIDNDFGLIVPIRQFIDMGMPGVIM